MDGPADNHETPKLLTVKEAAERCRVSVPHMYKLVRGGIVPAVRVGPNGRGPYRVDTTELEAWLYAPKR